MTPKLHRKFIKLAGAFSPSLESHIRRLGPLEIPSRKHLGLPHFLARTIIGQQLSTKAARTIWLRVKSIARETNQRIPQYFSRDNIEAIRACGVSGNKTLALLAINEAHALGTFSPARLRKMDFETRSETLLELRGVGQWTVDMASMFYFGDKDIWPVGDLAVARTFRSFLNARQARQMDGFAARFSPNRSYLACYMWQIVDGDIDVEPI
ncbi:MAG TPA: DNA-3-methyladenine glycosylase 2 family protein [Gammaproteobacteria bacterium]|nr:DNA-3-methyladenine glycosylase 2 family protein [Gammaproteobacteria bacterium]|tara:strand:- start:261 stop:890 length:630 start_codon:yes stop_codon:yes gene_type:complete